MGDKTSTSEKVAHCPECDQNVHPVERNGWRNFWAWVALLQFGAVVAAIVNTISPIDPDTAGGGIGKLLLWPALVSPAWSGIPCAIVAFLAAAVLSGKAGERASKNAACPKCGLPLSGQATKPGA